MSKRPLTHRPFAVLQDAKVIRLRPRAKVAPPPKLVATLDELLALTREDAELAQVVPIRRSTRAEIHQVMTEEQSRGVRR